MRVLSPNMLPPVRWLEGIDGEHGDLISALEQGQSGGLDPGAFAHPRNAGDAIPPGIDPVGGKSRQQRFCGGPVFGPLAFDQTDGLGQAATRSPSRMRCAQASDSRGLFAGVANPIQGTLPGFILGVVGHTASKLAVVWQRECTRRPPRTQRHPVVRGGLHLLAQESALSPGGHRGDRGVVRRGAGARWTRIARVHGREPVFGRRALWERQYDSPCPSTRVTRCNSPPSDSRP